MLCTCQRCCARFRDVVHVSEMLCTFPRSCARFTEVVHVSQKLCTFHKPPNNVRVQLYTHWAHSNQQKHWGDQTRSPDTYIYIHIYCIWRRFHIEYTHVHFWWITVPSGKRLRNYGKIHHFLLLGKSTISTGPFSMSLFLCLPGRVTPFILHLPIVLMVDLSHQFFLCLPGNIDQKITVDIPNYNGWNTMVYWITMVYWEILGNQWKKNKMIDSANPEIWYFRSCFNSFSRMSSNLRPEKRRRQAGWKKWWFLVLREKWAAKKRDKAKQLISYV